MRWLKAGPLRGPPRCRRRSGRQDPTPHTQKALVEVFHGSRLGPRARNGARTDVQRRPMVRCVLPPPGLWVDAVIMGHVVHTLLHTSLSLAGGLLVPRLWGLHLERDRRKS